MNSVTAVYERSGEHWLVHLKEDNTFHSYGGSLDEARESAAALSELYSHEKLDGALVSVKDEIILNEAFTGEVVKPDPDDDSYVWSLDEEYFQGGASSVEEAFKQAKAEYIDHYGTIWIGVRKQIDLGDISRGFAHRFIDGVADDLYDEYGDMSDGLFSHVTTNQIAELDSALSAVFSQWMEKHGLVPEFYGVTNVETRHFYELEVGNKVKYENGREATVLSKSEWAVGGIPLVIKFTDDGSELSVFEHECDLIVEEE